METNNDEEAKKIAAVEKALGEPVFIGFDDKTTKIRTSLFLLSVVSIGYALGGLQIDENSSFLGLKFTGLNDELFRTGLLVTMVYLLVHFLWNSVDTFVEWMLRISGTRVAFTTGSFYGNKNCDYPKHPRQSTLYNWWKGQSGILDVVDTRWKSIQSQAVKTRQDTDKQQDKLDPLGQKALIDLQRTLKALLEKADNIHLMQEELKKLYGAERIEVSLQRFDSWFKLFLQSQNLRWITIEFSLPVGLALWAIYLIWPR